jgi:hypothetical protein
MISIVCSSCKMRPAYVSYDSNGLCTHLCDQCWTTLGKPRRWGEIIVSNVKEQKQPQETPDWYELNIEEGIRPLVKLLRDNGFNTTGSCHHDMEITIDIHLDGEMQRLHNLLFNSGYRDYSISMCINVSDGYIVDKWMQVVLCKKEDKCQTTKS